MEIRQYIILVRRWFWLLILGVILGSAGAYVGSKNQTPIYKTASMVLVSQPSRDQLLEMGYLSSYQLIQTYSQLLVTTPILDEVSERLAYQVQKDQISTVLVRDTQILEISVEDKDPVMAAEIANLLSDVLVEYNEQLQATRFESLEESLNSQIQVIEIQIHNLQSEIDVNFLEVFEEQKQFIEVQIVSLQAEIVDLQGEISELTPSWGKPDSETQTLINTKQLQLEQTQGMLDLYQQLYFNIVSTITNYESGGSTSGNGSVQSQTNMTLYQQMYASLLSDYEAVRLARLENTPIVVQVESAKVKSVPIRPRPLINTLLGGLVGLMIAGGIVFLIEYLDDTVRTPEEVVDILNLSSLGFIAEMHHSGLNGRGEIYVSSNPRSPIAEAFRSLRTNIAFASSDPPFKTILITSPGPMEGKSTIAANLAHVMVQGGKRVAVVDCDLRRPRVHQFFDLHNRVGLSELFRGNAEFSSIIQEKNEDLFIVTSGKLPPNPVELLDSEAMDRFLDSISNVVDIVIIDSPPAVVTDPIVISSKVDGVLLIVHPGQTKLNSLKLAIDQFEHAGARVIGLVFNRISRHNAYYYEYYNQNYYYQGNEDRPSNSEENTKWPKRGGRKKRKTE